MPIKIIMSVSSQGEYEVHLNEIEGKITITRHSELPGTKAFPLFNMLRDVVQNCCVIDKHGRVFHQRSKHRVGLSHYLQLNPTSKTFGESQSGSTCPNKECHTHSMTHCMNFWLPRDCQRLEHTTDRGYRRTQMILVAVHLFIQQRLSTSPIPQSSARCDSSEPTRAERVHLQPSSGLDTWRMSLGAAVRHLKQCTPSHCPHIYGVKRHTDTDITPPPHSGMLPTQSLISHQPKTSVLDKITGLFFGTRKKIPMDSSVTTNYGSIQEDPKPATKTTPL
jgi:hypothetical protein